MNVKLGCELVSYWLCILRCCVGIHMQAKDRFDMHLCQQPVPFSSPSPDHQASSSIFPLGILVQLCVTLWGELIQNNNNSWFWQGYFKPVPIPRGSSRHWCKNIRASTAEEEVEEQKRAGSNQVFTLLKRFSNLHPTKNETTSHPPAQPQNSSACLEVGTGSPGETILGPGAREKVGADTQARRAEGTQRERHHLFWWLFAVFPRPQLKHAPFGIHFDWSHQFVKQVLVQEKRCFCDSPLKLTI